MIQYCCIYCGAVQESESSCKCPVCGYKMFPQPVNKTQVLKSEIQFYISSLQLRQISPDLLKHYGAGKLLKEEEPPRFPSAKKIQAYVCGAAKTEQFYENLCHSLTQIRSYLTTNYQQHYTVSMDQVKIRMGSLDAALRQALTTVGLEAELPEVTFQEVELSYREVPSSSLLAAAEQILTMLEQLAEKILRFIRQNNMYGTLYRREVKAKYTPSGDDLADLKKCADRVGKVLKKAYIVDIFSDGEAELEEMLRALWAAVETVLAVPVLEQQYQYSLADGTTLERGAFLRWLEETLAPHYAQVNRLLASPHFLEERSESSLMELYDRIIALDTQGILGMKESELLKVGESERKLEEMIGLSPIKDSVKKIKAYALANQGTADLNLHMCFLGNPGSGKTEVARHIAGILYENKILPTNRVVEVDRSGLVSQYFGATAEKTKRVIDRAMGGVLLIDEAYALGNASSGGITDYGKEAIDTLVKAMEDHRGKFCVILAGYKNEMLQMLSTNPGFQSRIPFMLDFPNYAREELKAIALHMAGHRGYALEDGALERMLDITDVKRKESNFANAREVRNLLDHVIMCQNIRCAGSGDKRLALQDVNQYIQDAKLHLPTADGQAKKILTGEDELEQLVGLETVKRMVRKIRAYAKRNKNENGFNLHMCFYGNPGTGKTEVARILSRILYDAGILPEAKVVETDAHGLIGRFVGETAPKTRAKIQEAMGGVLFVDEAYGLQGDSAVSYGQEAIAVLLKEMEDHRGQFCTILAGYRTEMEEMLAVNPGFASRIQFTLDFPDYTRQELGQIVQRFLAKKQYQIQPDALERLLDVTDYMRVRKNFANARTVRSILDQVLMNQNLRTEDRPGDRTVLLQDVEDYLLDEGIDLTVSPKKRGSIGFV